MNKEKPLWERLYFDQVYVEIARLIGYGGTTYQAMLEAIEPLERQFGKQRVQSAAYRVVTFEGQMTCNPKPLAEVKLRPEIRRLCWQLLGPPPESEVAFMTNPDGSSRRPKQVRPTQETPSKDQRQPASSEPPAKKARKKKSEPEKPTFANREAANSSAIRDQYWAAKEKNPDMMLLFRVDDYYELFGEDAEEASQLLGLTLTTRDQTDTMAGFPNHQLETYLHKLLKVGKRVAICDQDDPARGPIKREVKRVVASETAGK